MSKEIFKKPLFWIIFGLLILLLLFWFFTKPKGVGTVFTPDDLETKTTAPIVKEVMTPAQEKNLIKKIQAPLLPEDILSKEEETRLINGTTAPIPGAKTEPSF